MTGCCVKSTPDLNLKRYHVFVMFMLFTATGPLQTANQLFPAFGNVKPEWKCANNEVAYANSEFDGGNYSQDCSVIANCSSGGDNYSTTSTANFGIEEFHLEFRNSFLSLVQDLGLYCDQAVYMPIIGSMQMIGMVLGSLCFGMISDLYGRKLVTVVCGALLILFSTLSTFVSNWLWIGLLRLVCTLFNAGLIVGSQTLMIESLEPQQRIVACAFFWSSGWSRVVYALTTYATGNWRDALRTVNLGSLAVLIIIQIWVQESSRWLTQQNKISKAEDALRRIDRFNGEKTSSPLVTSPIVSKKSKSQNGVVTNTEPSPQAKQFGYGSLFKSPILRKRLFLASYFYFTCAFVTFGLDMSSGSLAGNFFTNQIVMGVVAQLIKPLIMVIDTYVPGFNRRLYHQLSLGMVVVVLVGIAVLSLFTEMQNVEICITVLAISGRCLIEYQWDAVMLYGLEMFPTVVRNSGLAFAATWGRIGDTLAPQVVYLSEYWPPASYMVLCTAGLISLTLSIAFAPDTKGKELSDTLMMEEEKGIKTDKNNMDLPISGGSAGGKLFLKADVNKSSPLLDNDDDDDDAIVRCDV